MGDSLHVGKEVENFRPPAGGGSGAVRGHLSALGGTTSIVAMGGPLEFSGQKGGEGVRFPTEHHEVHGG